MSDSVKEQVNVLALAQQIADGTAAESEHGLALKAVNTQIAVQLLERVNNASQGFIRLNDLTNRLVDRFVDRIEARLQEDLVQPEDALEMIDKLQKNQLAFLDLYRKIVQSPKGLFGDNLLSESERKVVQLFNSFKTQQEKQKFLQLVEQKLNEVETFDPEKPEDFEE